MPDDLPNLYHDTIKQHHKTPYHYEKKEDADLTLQAYNPLCGDRFQLFIYFQKGENTHLIKEIFFHGYGCSVARAATSILAQSMEGKDLSEGIQLCEQYLSLVNPESSPPSQDQLYVSDFEAFRAARSYPGRTTCASLSWQEMYDVLLEKKRALQV